MNDVRRFDRPAALLSYIVQKIMGGKNRMEDFMPFGKEEKDASLEDIISALGGVNRGKPR